MTANLTAGFTRKRRASDFASRLIRPRDDHYEVILRHFFASLWRAWLRILALKSHSSVLFVCFDESILEMMQSMKQRFSDKFFFMNHKWIPGFLTNSAVVRYNIERFFIEGEGFSTRSRRRTCLKMYRGLQKLHGHPELIVIVGRSSVALREIIPTFQGDLIATFDTCDGGSRLASHPIFVNHVDPRNVNLLVTMFLNRLSMIWT